MKRSEIRAAIRDFLHLVEKGAGAVPDNEECLPLALDRLALVQNFISVTFDDAEYPDPPRRDETTLRELVSHRFPNYGYYNSPDVVTEKIGEATCTVGDAIDDLADITSELRDVDWRWSNTSEADALWHLQFNYRSHWREHLRGLQLYLHALEWGN
jgi:hypothetical protein